MYRDILYPNMNFYELSSRVVNEGLRPSTLGEKFNNEKIVPKEMKELMQQCWDTDPNERPSFEEIVSILENVLENLQQISDTASDRGSRYYDSHDVTF
jgi:hypothetical protein